MADVPTLCPGPFSTVKIQCLLGIVMRSSVSIRTVTTKASWLATPMGGSPVDTVGWEGIWDLFLARDMAIKRQGLQRRRRSSSIYLASTRTGVWISQKPHKCWVCIASYNSKQKRGDRITRRGWPARLDESVSPGLYWETPTQRTQ